MKYLISLFMIFVFCFCCFACPFTDKEREDMQNKIKEQHPDWTDQEIAQFVDKIIQTIISLLNENEISDINITDISINKNGDTVLVYNVQSEGGSILVTQTVPTPDHGAKKQMRVVYYVYKPVLYPIQYLLKPIYMQPSIDQTTSKPVILVSNKMLQYQKARLSVCINGKIKQIVR